MQKNISETIKKLCEENKKAQNDGYGPFCAAICDNQGNILTIAHNSVLIDNSSLSHAEINAIRQIQQKFNTYDLSKYNLSICITAEPCVMCMGAIMWSGIKNVYYGVSSDIVEKITGFDEGYKPNWQNYFEQKGIQVIGNIESDACIEILNLYVNSNRKIYKPE